MQGAQVQSLVRKRSRMLCSRINKNNKNNSTCQHLWRTCHVLGKLLIIILWEWCSLAVWEVSPSWLQGMVLHQNPTASRQGSYKECRDLIHVQDLFFSSCARKSLYMNCWNHTYTSVPPGSHIWSPISKSPISFTLPHPFEMIGSNGLMSASIKLPIVTELPASQL